MKCPLCDKEIDEYNTVHQHSIKNSIDLINQRYVSKKKIHEKIVFWENAYESTKYSEQLIQELKSLLGNER